MVRLSLVDKCALFYCFHRVATGMNEEHYGLFLDVHASHCLPISKTSRECQDSYIDNTILFIY